MYFIRRFGHANVAFALGLSAALVAFTLAALFAASIIPAA